MCFHLQHGIHCIGIMGLHSGNLDDCHGCVQSKSLQQCTITTRFGTNTGNVHRCTISEWGIVHARLQFNFDTICN